MREQSSRSIFFQEVNMVHQALRPAASVVIPVYNTARYLERAIDSVLNQTFTDFELLLLDDGSTDGSSAILDRYQACDSRCRVFHNHNRGVITTRNEGNSMARADIIFLMDSDDICMPDRFEKQFTYLSEHPECVAVGSRILLIDQDDMPIMHMGDKLTHEEIDSTNISGEAACFFQPTVAVRKSAVEKVGGYRAEYRRAEDFDLFLRLAEVGTLTNLPDVLLKYRQHLSSIGYLHGNEQADTAIRSIKDACNRRGIEYREPSAGDQSNIDRSDAASAYRKWAWWALGAGFLPTARKYAGMAIKAAPFSRETWRLCACVLRGY